MLVNEWLLFNANHDEYMENKFIFDEMLLSPLCPDQHT